MLFNQKSQETFFSLSSIVNFFQLIVIYEMTVFVRYICRNINEQALSSFSFVCVPFLGYGGLCVD